MRGKLTNVTVDARYLGARHVPSASPATEIAYRLSAMKKVWNSLLYFFTTTETSLQYKILIYRATVVNAALSGLETLIGHRRPLSRHDLAPCRST